MATIETCPYCGSPLYSEFHLGSIPDHDVWEIWCPEGCPIDPSKVNPGQCIHGN